MGRCALLTYAPSDQGCPGFGLAALGRRLGRPSAFSHAPAAPPLRDLAGARRLLPAVPPLRRQLQLHRLILPVTAPSHKDSQRCAGISLSGQRDRRGRQASAHPPGSRLAAMETIQEHAVTGPSQQPQESLLASRAGARGQGGRPRSRAAPLAGAGIAGHALRPVPAAAVAAGAARAAIKCCCPLPAQHAQPHRRASNHSRPARLADVPPMAAAGGTLAVAGIALSAALLRLTGAHRRRVRCITGACTRRWSRRLDCALPHCSCLALPHPLAASITNIPWCLCAGQLQEREAKLAELSSQLADANKRVEALRSTAGGEAEVRRP